MHSDSKSATFGEDLGQGSQTVSETEFTNSGSKSAAFGEDLSQGSDDLKMPDLESLDGGLSSEDI